MKPICSHCHVDDHIRLNCPALAARKKACYQCGSTDHLRAGCPLAPWNRKRKQVKRVPAEDTEPRRSSFSLEDYMVKALTEPTNTEVTTISIDEDAHMESTTEDSTAINTGNTQSYPSSTVEAINLEDVPE
jgi:hypothetical protein